jgi:hypothetical protein
MKKVLVVFLLFVSGSIFAKEEMGRLIIELRDYEINQDDPRWSLKIPPKDGRTFQQYEIHLINTISPKYSLPYSDIQKFVDLRWNSDKNRPNWGGSYYTYNTPDKKVIVHHYINGEEGRWNPVHIHFPWLLLREDENHLSSGYKAENSFDIAAQALTIFWMGVEPGTKYSWDSTWDLNNEEMYWIVPWMSRKDEQGRPMHSFKVEIIFYKE